MITIDGKSGIRTRKSFDDSRPASRSPHNRPKAPSKIDTASNAPSAKQKDSMSPQRWRARLRSPWTCSALTCSITTLALAITFLIAQSFLTRHLDPKGAAMSYMRPAFARFSDFDSEHTRLATKYSLYLYREAGIDEDTRVKGIPVLFIPGNAGSYKQVRPLAAEAAVHFHDVLQNDPEAINAGKRALDFFTVDFNEDFTAFHGRTLIEQAEYLNEAIAYILSLYHNEHRSLRDPHLPDPTSVILVGHSMGGIVARTMLTMPNYRPDSINTILTLAAPHARAPISFDAEIVDTYSRVNKYWRQAYAQKWGGDNPLWHVTTVSIAGGSLDTIVPSDYATLASLVPPSHGFTVFTSTIPRVWTSMDHLAITWCDQLRKAIIPALFEVIDASRPNQTKPRDDRMRSFKKWFLTGMEDIVEPDVSRQKPSTVIALSGDGNTFVPTGERLALSGGRLEGPPQTYILPIPPPESPDLKRFTLLSNQQIGTGGLDVYLCSLFPLNSGQSPEAFTVSLDSSSNKSGSTRLACRDATTDTVLLPASYSESRYPFENYVPFSYLQYNVQDIAEHQFVAIVDKADSSHYRSIIAEFSSISKTTHHVKGGFLNMLLSGTDVSLPADRSMVNEVKIPSIHSSLLAYNFALEQESCNEQFAPLVRQHIANPYESKYFVNARRVEISMHGLAPYIPPSLQGQSESLGLSLQIWADPTCEKPIRIWMTVDIRGSMGKLWMRYRTAFAAFPLLVVALVLRKQFRNYDQGAHFMSFTESMDQSLRSSIPVLLLGLTMLSMSLSQASQSASAKAAADRLGWRANSTETAIDFTVNDLLLGSQDPFFWFLVPLFGLMSIGICIVANYAVLVITNVLATLYTFAAGFIYRADVEAKILDTFSIGNLRRRVLTAVVLLFLVALLIPYQFVFVVLCVVQIATCVRALALARSTHSNETIDLYNYAHSILLLMLWILPINIPVLVVWFHNLAVHYLTPFSSHHNILSITPFIVLVLVLSTGKMVPRVNSWIRHLTNVLFFGLAVYAAVYGVTFAYLLHTIVDIICAWLVLIHLFARGESGTLWDTLSGNDAQRGQHSPAANEFERNARSKKRP